MCHVKKLFPNRFAAASTWRLLALASIFCLLTIQFELASSGGERSPWTTSRVIGVPEPPKPYSVERIYPELEFQQPVEMMPLADTGRIMLLEVAGRLVTFVDDPAATRTDLAADLSGLVDQFSRAFGFAVHPKFSENREIFIVYARNPVAHPDGTRLSRFRMTKSDPPHVDLKSEEILLTWPSGGHNGCAIRFDTDGYLYFSAGDGAGPFPPDQYDVSQDLSDLRSTICRIDVDRRDTQLNYSVPKDNPFVTTRNARPEIWAYGFRNPWRFSIDRKTGAMMCGDVGWELWELVFHVERGGNYGWSIFEGPQPIRSDIAPGPTPIIKPLVAYPHTMGLSVTGGFTYRGKELPELDGAYLYGDYVTGKIWGIRFEKNQVTWQAELAETGLPIISFAEDRDGEVMVMSFAGSIHRLRKNPEPDRSNEFPRRLSETGLFSDVKSLEPAPGVIPYRLQATAFEGGTVSSHLIAIPGKESIQAKKIKRQWVYPKGTVFVKTISLPTGTSPAHPHYHLETQLLHFDGLTWNPYTYAWNEQQVDAELVVAAGGQLPLANAVPHSELLPKIWRLHSRAECISCHNSQAGSIASFELANLTAPAHSDSTCNQLDELVRLGIFSEAPSADWVGDSMVNPADETATIAERARSYLAINCAHCHCRGGGGTVALELPYSLELDQLNAIDKIPTQGAFGIQDARVIVPGDPYRSVLYYRLSTLGAGHMPKVWGRENDSLGLKLVHDWIASLADNRKTPNGTQPSLPSVDKGTGKLLASTEQALHWFHLTETGQLDQRSRESLIRLATSGSDPVVRGMFERFISPEQRVQRVGADVDLQQILAMTGNAERGRERFLNSSASQCRNCHRVAGKGQSVGPDLDGIAKKRTREELLESLLDPSRRIEQEFRTHNVLTAGGAVHTGLLIEQTPEYVVIRVADGKQHKVATGDIEQQRILGLSLMPAGQVNELTAEELADLLAFLESLR